MTKVIPIEVWPCDQDEFDINDEGHTCPYQEEINGDSTTLCHCDEEATRQCAEDI